jgi:hypothetical protein
MKLAKLFYGNTFLLYVVIPNLLWFKHYDRNQGRPRWPKRLLMASAWVLMECNSVWMHAYSSNVCSIRLIPFQKFHHKSLPYWVWCLLELLQTDGAEDSGRFDIHPHCLEYVHIVYTSVKELSNSWRDLNLSHSSCIEMEMSSLSLIPWSLARAGVRLNGVVPCCEGMKDEDRDESSDLLSLWECGGVPRLDEPG